MKTATAREPPVLVQRRRIHVRGQVQGVGFRPFVYRLAMDLGLAGWVRNDAAGVEIEIAGAETSLEQFHQRLVDELPPLARIDRIDCSRLPGGDVSDNQILREQSPESVDAYGTNLPAANGNPFCILSSTRGTVSTGVTPDAAICPECLEEVLTPGNRRYRYAFINCTHCGPRYTLTAALPYDRPNTSMADFLQCSTCLEEYTDPLHRRFHAQPNACPDCGPELRLLDATGRDWPGGDDFDPIREAVQQLRAGKILAVKGLGGFHLLCDARNAQAVARLRSRKHREAKPLAVMAVHPQVLDDLVFLQDSERALLNARERPIVLVRKRPDCDQVLPGVAPGLSWLGVLLAYTPLQYLLFHEAAGRPAGSGWMRGSRATASSTAKADVLGSVDLLVCTSANPGGEPLVIDNTEAVRRVGGIADALLVHDRDILVRCDDSVLRVGVEGPAFIRRARGYTPAAIRLPRKGPSTLALGAWLKSTACITRGNEAFVSQHIGDLDTAATCRFLEEAVQHLLRILEIRPERIACDRHPDFFSSQLAQRLAEQWDLPLLRVQHHHAHLAAVQAEQGLSGAVLGVAMDGVGLGLDGTPWGGELMFLDGAHCSRIGHLHPLALPGGDRAARESWRMAAAALHALGRTAEIPQFFPLQAQAKGLQELLQRNLRCPLTSSLGRHFDAAAGLLGIQHRQVFEGQAAMLLEGMAEQYGPAEPLPAAWEISSSGVLDLRPLLRWVADHPLANALHAVPHEAQADAARRRAAAVFHATLAAALVDWIATAAEATGLRRVVFSGGCALNQVLMRAVQTHLKQRALQGYWPSLVPANDGGISLGQAWVAMQTEPTDFQ